MWRQELDGEPLYVSEIRYFKEGKRDGFDWWVNEDQRSVWLERHFREDQLHGIERSWNFDRKLRRGFPRYWINGKRVMKRQYLRARIDDPTLPLFRDKDTRFRRSFLPEIIARQTPFASHS